MGDGEAAGHQAASASCPASKKSFGVTLPSVCSTIRARISGRGTRAPERYLVTDTGFTPMRSANSEVDRRLSERNDASFIVKEHTKLVLESNTNLELVFPKPVSYQFGMGLRELREAEGLTQTQLAEAVGTSQPQINRLENGDRKLTKEWAERLAPVLKTTPQKLLFSEGAEVPAPEPSSARIAPEADQLEVGERDIPIMGTTVGGNDGEFYLNGDPVDYVRRMPGIARRKNVFGVYIQNTSMSPRYEPGDLVYASPSPPARPGDDILIELAPMEGERAGPSYIKRLVRRSGTRVVCQQFNPAGEVEYDTRHIKQIYRIIPMAELAGF